MRVTHDRFESSSQPKQNGSLAEVRRGTKGAGSRGVRASARLSRAVRQGSPAEEARCGARGHQRVNGLYILKSCLAGEPTNWYLVVLGNSVIARAPESHPPAPPLFRLRSKVFSGYLGVRKALKANQPAARGSGWSFAEPVTVALATPSRASGRDWVP